MVFVVCMVGYSCTKKENDKVSVETKPVTEITTSSAKCGGNVVLEGNASVGLTGICWSETPSPTTKDCFTTDNSGAGDFTSTMKNLVPGTKYYVRAYATIGTEIMYGAEIDFTTESVSSNSVVVNTSDIADITSSSAKCGGTVTVNDNTIVASRGVCWSIRQNPTTADSHTADGQGIGSFPSYLTGLSAETTYFVKAYAETADGLTVYGDEKSFRTLSGNGNGNQDNPVVVVTNEITNITTSSAECGGNVVCNSQCEIYVRGVCWSTAHNPSVSDEHTADGDGPGSFISTLTGLAPGTRYYVKAYAQTDSEILYGDEKSFTTNVGSPSEIEVTEVSFDFVKISVAPSSSVGCYYTRVVGVGNAVRHEKTETSLTFNNLTPETTYTIEFTFYDANDNLLDSEQISVKTIEKPYEYATVTVSLDTQTPVSLKLKFEPSANTAFYLFNIGETLTSTHHVTGSLTQNFNCLIPNTEYTFSIVAYDHNGVAGEVIHPTFTTEPSPYANYFNIGTDFHELKSAQFSTESYDNGLGLKVLTIRGYSSTCWIRLIYTCYISELNLNWPSGTYNIQTSASLHCYNGMYTRNGSTILDFPYGTLTITRSGNICTIDMSSDDNYIRVHFSGVMN